MERKRMFGLYIDIWPRSTQRKSQSRRTLTRNRSDKREATGRLILLEPVQVKRSAIFLCNERMQVCYVRRRGGRFGSVRFNGPEEPNDDSELWGGDHVIGLITMIHALFQAS